MSEIERVEVTLKLPKQIMNCLVGSALPQWFHKENVSLEALLEWLIVDSVRAMLEYQSREGDVFAALFKLEPVFREVLGSSEIR